MNLCRVSLHQGPKTEETPKSNNPIGWERRSRPKKYKIGLGGPIHGGKKGDANMASFCMLNLNDPHSRQYSS